MHDMKIGQLAAVAHVTRRVLDAGDPWHLILLKKQLDARSDLFRLANSSAAAGGHESPDIKEPPLKYFTFAKFENFI